MKLITAIKSLGCAAVLALGLSACKSPHAVEYYVRFTVGVNPGDEIEMVYNDNYNRSHEIKGVINDDTAVGEIGPVFGGFSARCSATVNGGQDPQYIEISYSQDGAPYEVAIKASNINEAVWHVPLEEDL